MRTWRFVTLLLTALTMSMAFAHLLEMPAKRGYGAFVYVTVQQSLYQMFGTVGAALEVGAVLSSIGLVFLVHGRRPAFLLTVTAAVLVLAAHLAFWVLIAPVNAQMSTWTPAGVPSAWTVLRDRWEFTHAARALLMLSAFAALVMSVLVETPGRSDQAAAREPEAAPLRTRIALRGRDLTG